MEIEKHKQFIIEIISKSTKAELIELIYRFCKRLLG